MSFPKSLSHLAQSLQARLRPGSREQSPTGAEKGKAAQRHEAKRESKREKEERIQREQAELEERRRQEEELARLQEDAETRARYGTHSHPGTLSTIAEVSEKTVGSEVAFRARVVHQREVSSKLDFVLLRDQTHSIQGVLHHTSPHMIKWVQRLKAETLVHVTGTLQKPVEPVRSASISDLELSIYSIHVVNAATKLPFDNYEPPEALRQRLSARVLDLRHPSNHAIFRIRSAIVRSFRETLERQDFLEIQTPKLMPAATESGSSVFKVKYFGRTAFLAQSPQLSKQMAIAADMNRVYEIGPVFRAENSNTHRHLTEYTGLDIEMALGQSYRELISVVDHVLKSIFASVQSMPELQVVRERFPSQDLVWLEETLILDFRDGIQLLRDDGRDVQIEDLSTSDEIRLGQLVKEKYKTDYYMLDKFPANARPFYTHKAEDAAFTHSFDVFVRGQEICTGGQRIHDAKLLRQSMQQVGIGEGGMEDYLAAFDLGPPPHGGAGLGLERIVFLLLDLGDVRNATLFHRDPRSLPERPPSLPHPEADTTKHWTFGEPPPIEKLIANYGDASNTSWLDERFQVWRHPNGGAVGWVKQDDKLAMIIGDPLCDESQYGDVVSAFIKYVVRELHLTPIWMLVSEQVQHLLAHNHDWRTLSCVEEQRVPSDARASSTDRKARRAEKEGVQMRELSPDDDFMRRADRKIEEWRAARMGKGKQVHLTEVRPWKDREHRRYFAAEKEGDLVALVVLAQLAPRHGWQVKWALDFPKAPNGTIEALIETAIMSAPGPLTFGAGVSDTLKAGAHLGGMRAKFLASTYETIVRSLNLSNKSAFREKFGTLGEEVYICYPRSVGMHDLKQIIKFFQD